MTQHNRKSPGSVFWAGATLALLAASVPVGGSDYDAVEERKIRNLPATVEEARGRARWLHEAMNGALRVMHRDFFDDDQPGRIPSQSLEDVFQEMARSWGVEMRWLGGSGTQDIDHEPQDRFEERAEEALLAGEPEYEAVYDDRLRFVGAIPLKNECLKCHVPQRKTLEDRVAGLSITIPLRTEESR